MMIFVEVNFLADMTMMKNKSQWYKFFERKHVKR